MSQVSQGSQPRSSKPSSKRSKKSSTHSQSNPPGSQDGGGPGDDPGDNKSPSPGGLPGQGDDVNDQAGGSQQPDGGSPAGLGSGNPGSNLGSALKSGGGLGEELKAAEFDEQFGDENLNSQGQPAAGSQTGGSGGKDEKEDKDKKDRKSTKSGKETVNQSTTSGAGRKSTKQMRKSMKSKRDGGSTRKSKKPPPPESSSSSSDSSGGADSTAESQQSQTGPNEKESDGPSCVVLIIVALVIVGLILLAGWFLLGGEEPGSGAGKKKPSTNKTKSPPKKDPAPDKKPGEEGPNKGDGKGGPGSDGKQPDGPAGAGEKNKEGNAGATDKMHDEAGYDKGNPKKFRETPKPEGSAAFKSLFSNDAGVDKLQQCAKDGSEVTELSDNLEDEEWKNYKTSNIPLSYKVKTWSGGEDSSSSFVEGGESDSSSEFKFVISNYGSLGIGSEENKDKQFVKLKPEPAESDPNKPAWTETIFVISDDPKWISDPDTYFPLKCTENGQESVAQNGGAAAVWSWCGAWRDDELYGQDEKGSPMGAFQPLDEVAEKAKEVLKQKETGGNELLASKATMCHIGVYPNFWSEVAGDDEPVNRYIGHATSVDFKKHAVTKTEITAADQSIWGEKSEKKFMKQAIAELGKSYAIMFREILDWVESEGDYKDGGGSIQNGTQVRRVRVMPLSSANFAGPWGSSRTTKYKVTKETVAKFCENKDEYDAKFQPGTDDICENFQDKEGAIQRYDFNSHMEAPERKELYPTGFREWFFQSGGGGGVLYKHSTPGSKDKDKGAPHDAHRKWDRIQEISIRAIDRALASPRNITEIEEEKLDGLFSLDEDVKKEIYGGDEEVVSILDKFKELSEDADDRAVIKTIELAEFMLHSAYRMSKYALELDQPESEEDDEDKLLAHRGLKAFSDDQEEEEHISDGGKEDKEEKDKGKGEGEGEGEEKGKGKGEGEGEGEGEEDKGPKKKDGDGDFKPGSEEDPDADEKKPKKAPDSGGSEDLDSDERVLYPATVTVETALARKERWTGPDEDGYKKGIIFELLEEDGHRQDIRAKIRECETEPYILASYMDWGETFGRTKALQCPADDNGGGAKKVTHPSSFLSLRSSKSKKPSPNSEASKVGSEKPSSKSTEAKDIGGGSAPPKLDYNFLPVNLDGKKISPKTTNPNKITLWPSTKGTINPFLQHQVDLSMWWYRMNGAKEPKPLEQADYDKFFSISVVDWGKSGRGSLSLPGVLNRDGRYITLEWPEAYHAGAAVSTWDEVLPWRGSQFHMITRRGGSLHSVVGNTDTLDPRAVYQAKSIIIKESTGPPALAKKKEEELESIQDLDLLEERSPGEEAPSFSPGEEAQSFLMEYVFDFEENKTYLNQMHLTGIDFSSVKTAKAAVLLAAKQWKTLFEQILGWASLVPYDVTKKIISGSGEAGSALQLGAGGGLKAAEAVGGGLKAAEAVGGGLKAAEGGGKPVEEPPATKEGRERTEAMRRASMLVLRVEMDDFLMNSPITTADYNKLSDKMTELGTTFGEVFFLGLAYVLYVKDAKVGQELLNGQIPFYTHPFGGSSNRPRGFSKPNDDLDFEIPLLKRIEDHKDIFLNLRDIELTCRTGYTGQFAELHSISQKFFAKLAGKGGPEKGDIFGMIGELGDKSMIKPPLEIKWGKLDENDIKKGEDDNTAVDKGGAPDAVIGGAGADGGGGHKSLSI